MESNDFQVKMGELVAPFEPGEVRTRPGGGGASLSYVTARTVMNRLDNVLGAGQWWDEYRMLGEAVLCKLTIIVGQDVVSKEDVGSSGNAKEDDEDKSAVSSALKRAAAKFGIGRYLYCDGVPNWHPDPPPEFQPRQRQPQAPTSQPYRSQQSGPVRPQTAPTQQPQRPADRSGDRFPLEFKVPQNPSGYFPWIKRLGEHYQEDLIPFVNNYCDSCRIPRFTAKWSGEQAAQVFEALIGYLREHANHQGEWGNAGDEIPF